MHLQNQTFTNSPTPSTTKPASIEWPFGGNRGVLSAATTLLANKEAFALAIVVSTQGSTYRKPGALAVIARNGVTNGVLSGGCLEPTVHDVAMQALASRAPQILLLDTQSKDDLIFGSGSACRGVMRVLIIPVSPDKVPSLYSIIANNDQAQSALRVAVAIEQPWCASGCAWSGDDTWQWDHAITGIDSLRKSNVGEYTLVQSSERARIAVFEVKPAPRILVIGAGPETAPLLRLTRSLGWFITLVDHREAALSAYTEGADRTLHARPVTALAQLSAERFLAALVMTHTAAVDLEALQALALRTEPYVGLLGPPARRDELLIQLSDGERAALESRLHAPLGLRLGGDGPEPLALSIVAEVQRFLTQQ